MCPVVLRLEARKCLCLNCGHQFRQQFPGVLKWQQASEAFRRMIFTDHWDGINRCEGIGSATVERYFQYYVRRRAAERSSAPADRCREWMSTSSHTGTAAPLPSAI
jgi:hypothetical protein